MRDLILPCSNRCTSNMPWESIRRDETLGKEGKVSSKKERREKNSIWKNAIFLTNSSSYQYTTGYECACGNKILAMEGKVNIEE